MSYRKRLNRLIQVKQGKFRLDFLDEMTDYINKLFNVKVLYCNYIHEEIPSVVNRVIVFCEDKKAINRLSFEKYGTVFVRKEDQMIQKFTSLVKKYSYAHSYQPLQDASQEYDLLAEYTERSPIKIDVRDIRFRVCDFRDDFLYSIVHDVQTQIKNETDYKEKMGITDIVYFCSKVLVVFDHSPSETEKRMVTDFLEMRIIKKDIFNYMNEKVDFWITHKEQGLLY